MVETKRFIGSDLSRLYGRVRREFGPDAVIVGTRSLLREGAEPLTEIVAAPPGSEDELSMDLQRTLVEAVLERVTASPSLTVGDLEDRVARETVERSDRAPELSPALERSEAELPEWLHGFVADAPSGPAEAVAAEAPASTQSRRSKAAVRLAPLPDTGPDEVAPPEMVPRRAPSLKPAGKEEAMPPAPVVDLAPRLRPAPAGIGAALLAVGFSEPAAEAVARSVHGGLEPHLAVARFVGDLATHYPDEATTALITIEGGEGSGRTTALMRMALDCADAGREAILLASDGVHVGAREQVHAYGEAIGIRVVDAYQPADITKALGRVPRGTCLFVDVPAGPWRVPHPVQAAHYRYLALPAHWQREAIDRGLGMVTQGGAAGAIITFADLAPSLTPILSLAIESGVGLAFISSGRDVSSGIGVVEPLTLASGIFTIMTGETTNGRLVATA